MITRRQLGALGLLPLMWRSGLSQTASPKIPGEDDLPPLPRTSKLDLSASEGEPDFSSPDLEDQALGKHDPGGDVKAYAKRILDQAPYNCRPVEVAKYFHALGKGETKFGVEGRPYARGWPYFYNPVIVAFFTATSLKPSGDETSWCAAFMNYCIARSASRDGAIGPEELKRGTRSASSGSFRCFGNAVPPGQMPKEGDIAVWALEGTIDGCNPGQGHVGFVVTGPTGNADRPYLILGGNQSGDLLDPKRTRRDGVFVKAMPTKYAAVGTPLREKRLFSYRTAAFL